MNRVRVFVGCSLDGFIAGPNDDLSWLVSPPQEGETPDDHGFSEFLAQVGALLMGRRTYDIVAGFDGPWPYGERAVLVATHRPLLGTEHPVTAVAGSIDELVRQAQAAANDLDVYLDGGILTRQALDAHLIDELTITILPIVLGAGVPLFAGLSHYHRLELISERQVGEGFVQITYRPRRPEAT